LFLFVLAYLAAKIQRKSEDSKRFFTFFQTGGRVSGGEISPTRPCGSAYLFCHCAIKGNFATRYENLVLRQKGDFLGCFYSKSWSSPLFSSKSLAIQKKQYLCATRTRQASQRCSNVRVVLFYLDSAAL